MTIEGISHIALIVRNLDRATRFFCEGLGAKEVYDNRGAKQHSVAPEKFFTLGDAWIAVLEGEPLPERSYRHLAFKTTSDALPALEQNLRKLGVEIKPPRPRVDGEGESLYFYDFDNHLFELHTGTLEQRLACYAKSAGAR